MFLADAFKLPTFTILGMIANFYFFLEKIDIYIKKSNKRDSRRTRFELAPLDPTAGSDLKERESRR